MDESRLSAAQFTCLQQLLPEQGWTHTASDGGQNQFVGWEAHLRYEKDGAVVTLIQGERAGQAYYTWEANPRALMQMSALLAQCGDDRQG